MTWVSNLDPVQMASGKIYDRAVTMAYTLTSALSNSTYENTFLLLHNKPNRWGLSFSVWYHFDSSTYSRELLAQNLKLKERLLKVRSPEYRPGGKDIETQSTD